MRSSARWAVLGWFVRATEGSRCRVFGAGVRERHGGGPEHYSARIGELVLELYPARTARTAGVRLGLIVDDLASVVARLIEGGAEVSQRGGEWVVVDPDGHVIALSSSS